MVAVRVGTVEALEEVREAAWAHVTNHDAAARIVMPIAMAAIAAAYLFTLR